jgi:PAS domain S-box-containing protein
VVTDLTEQKKNEEVVASERLARSIIEQAAEAIIVCDTSGKTIRFSNATPRLCGCDPIFQRFEDLINLRSSEGADAGESILPVSSALNGSTILGLEATFERNSQKFHFLLNSGPLKNDDDKIIGCVVTLSDITELKQLEEQACRQAEELTTVMETAPVGIWIGHDPQSHNITGNRMANEFYDAEVGENVSANVTPVRRFFFKDRELTADELPMQEAASKDINVRNVELAVLLPSGKRRVILGSANPLHDADGRVRGSVGAFIDITERKQAEEELRESEERYRELFESSVDGIIITDLAGNILKVNPAYEKMLGYSMEELRHLSYQQLTPALWHENEARIVQDQILEQGYSDEYEKEYIRKDGSIFPISIRVWLSRDKHGHPQGMWGLVRDITERKLAEEALKESEEKYREVFETVQEVFYIDRLIYDEQGNVVDWIFEDLNPAGFELLGLKDIDEAKGKRGSEVLGLEVASFYLPMIEKARQSSKAVTFQYQSPYVDKEFLTSYIVNGDRLISAQMDITEIKRMETALKKSESSLAEAQRIAHIGSWEWDIQTGKIDWSAELYSIYGLDPKTFVPTINSFADYIHPDDQEFVNKIINQIVSDGKSVSFDFRIVSADGATRILNVRGEIVDFDENGKPCLMVGTNQDITERKRVEEALREAYENLQMQSEELQAQAEELHEANEALIESEKRFRLIFDKSMDARRRTGISTYRIFITTPQYPL